MIYVVSKMLRLKRTSLVSETAVQAVLKPVICEHLNDIAGDNPQHEVVGLNRAMTAVWSHNSTSQVVLSRIICNIRE